MATHPEIISSAMTSSIELIMRLCRFASVCPSYKHQANRLAKNIVLCTNALELLARTLKVYFAITTEATATLTDDVYHRSYSAFLRIETLLPDRKYWNTNLTWTLKSQELWELIAELEYLRSTASLLVSVIITAQRSRYHEESAGKYGLQKMAVTLMSNDMLCLKARAAIVEYVVATDEMNELDTTKSPKGVPTTLAELTTVKTREMGQAHILKNCADILENLIDAWTKNPEVVPNLPDQDGEHFKATSMPRGKRQSLGNIFSVHYQGPRTFWRHERLLRSVGLDGLNDDNSQEVWTSLPVIDAPLVARAWTVTIQEGRVALRVERLLDESWNISYPSGHKVHLKTDGASWTLLDGISVTVDAHGAEEWTQVKHSDTGEQTTSSVTVQADKDSEAGYCDAGFVDHWGRVILLDDDCTCTSIFGPDVPLQEPPSPAVQEHSLPFLGGNRGRFDPDLLPAHGSPGELPLFLSGDDIYRSRGNDRSSPFYPPGPRRIVMQSSIPRSLTPLAGLDIPASPGSEALAGRDRAPLRIIREPPLAKSRDAMLQTRTSEQSPSTVRDSAHRTEPPPSTAPRDIFGAGDVVVAARDTRPWLVKRPNNPITHNLRHQAGDSKQSQTRLDISTSESPIARLARPAHGSSSDHRQKNEPESPSEESSADFLTNYVRAAQWSRGREERREEPSASLAAASLRMAGGGPVRR